MKNNIIRFPITERLEQVKKDLPGLRTRKPRHTLLAMLGVNSVLCSYISPQPYTNFESINVWFLAQDYKGDTL